MLISRDFALLQLVCFSDVTHGITIHWNELLFLAVRRLCDPDRQHQIHQQGLVASTVTGATDPKDEQVSIWRAKVGGYSSESRVNPEPTEG